MSYELIDRFLRNNLYDDDYAEYSAALDALCAAPAIPEGWKLVPVEPTQEMLDAFKHRYKEGDFWRERIHGAVAAMLAAAPKQKGGAA